jgi:hypothetical protein
MANIRHPWRLGGLLMLATALATGCNLPSLLYFTMTGFSEPMEEPGEMKLASSKEVKVVILTHFGQDMRAEFVRVDQDLSNLLARKLQESCKENNEKVTVISTHKVQEYKSNHPSWYLKPETVGQHFDADKVIYLEIERLSLYEAGSANQLYRGRAAIAVKLYDLKNPDDYRAEKMFTCEYPTSRGPIAIDDKNKTEFYQEFLNFVVKHLSWYFTAHPISDSVSCD